MPVNDTVENIKRMMFFCFCFLVCGCLPQQRDNPFEKKAQSSWEDNRLLKTMMNIMAAFKSKLNEDVLLFYIISGELVQKNNNYASV